MPFVFFQQSIPKRDAKFSNLSERGVTILSSYTDERTLSGPGVKHLSAINLAELAENDPALAASFGYGDESAELIDGETGEAPSDADASAYMTEWKPGIYRSAPKNDWVIRANGYIYKWFPGEWVPYFEDNSKMTRYPPYNFSPTTIPSGVSKEWYKNPSWRESGYYEIGKVGTDSDRGSKEYDFIEKNHVNKTLDRGPKPTQATRWHYYNDMVNHFVMRPSTLEADWRGKGNPPDYIFPCVAPNGSRRSWCKHRCDRNTRSNGKYDGPTEPLHTAWNDIDRSIYLS